MTKKTDANMKAMKNVIRKQLTSRTTTYDGGDKSLGIFIMILLTLSICLITAGGIVGSWTSIVAGTIILIFIGWSVKN